MVKHLTYVLVVILIFGYGTVFADISGSDHDFSGEAWSGGRICIVCHTPHNADMTVTGSPLWNHEVSAAAFTEYDSPTLDATVATSISGVSLLCLSCHDGTVAIDSYGGASGTNIISGSQLIGTSLANDHPIDFTYDAALATTDGELFDPSSATSGLGGTIANDMLFSGEMQCGSCHDAHDDTNNNFLVKSNAASALCLTCHDK